MHPQCYLIGYTQDGKPANTLIDCEPVEWLVKMQEDYPNSITMLFMAMPIADNQFNKFKDYI